MAFGVQTLLQKQQPTTQLKGSTTMTLPSSALAYTLCAQRSRQAPQPLHSSELTVGNQGICSRG